MTTRPRRTNDFQSHGYFLINVINKCCAVTGRKHALNKKYALNSKVCLIARVYGLCYVFIMYAMYVVCNDVMCVCVDTSKRDE